MSDNADYVNEVRYQMGKAKIAEFSNGPSVTGTVMETLNNVAPHMARQAMEFVLGDVLSRPGLDTKTRELLNVAVLTAIGAALELKLHTHVALNVGCTREQVVEAVSQQAVYVGFPTAINGIKVLEEVFKERDAQGVKN
jgi:4-carboxymuconolactone decarboxylase